MTTLYKLTSLQSQTYNQTQWGENVTHELPVRDIYQLCSKQVLHAYASPKLAVLMDPIQASLLPHAILWEAKGDVAINDGTRVGCTKLTTLKRIPIPTITLEQRVTFALKCALHVYKEPSWVAWAQAWLAGTNRADATARAAYVAAADAAYYAAADAAAYYAASYYAAADAAAYYAAAYAARADAARADAASYYAAAADADYYAAAYAARADAARTDAAVDAARAAAHAAYAVDAAAHAAHAADAADAAAADFAFVGLIAKEVCKD